MTISIILIALLIFTIILLAILLYKQSRSHQQTQESARQLAEQLKSWELWQLRFEEREKMANELRDKLLGAQKEQQTEQRKQREHFDEHQIKSLKLLQESLQSSLHRGMTEIRQQVSEALNNYAELLGKRVDKLTSETDKHLKGISQQVEKRLSEGFEKTTATFTDVIKRLALIDEAQKKITELSSNVVNLQAVLADKRSRGAFGEVQLAALLRNVMPEQSFALQYTLSNSKRVDCLLFLPEPTGHLAIDAKFPLESYRRMTDIQLAETERRQAEQQFRLDIRKHIQDISEKYIIQGETAEGAIMFIPAEAVFAEIHAHHPGRVEQAHKARVWMVSPTTMMAVLTTARAVLKDAATRKQVHIIQEHLGMLGKDFSRFQKRMDNLARHINQAQEDVDQVHKSSQKISSRFSRIEQVELQEETTKVELEEELEAPLLEETESWATEWI